MPRFQADALERRAAFIATMERVGVEPIVLPVAARSWNFEELGYQEAGRILDEGGFPTRTVLCANDRLAFGVIAAAFERRLRVGREEGCVLRVAGHDDHPLSRFACPSLTTVAQDYQGIAAACMEMLFSRIGEDDRARADKSNARQFEAKLIMRDSA
jgi:DNA-binding LacI/PurR family transcriptional regulator